MDRARFLERIRERLPGTDGGEVAIPSDWAVAVSDPLERFGSELEAVGGALEAGGVAEVMAHVLDGLPEAKVLVAREDGVPEGLEEAIVDCGGRVLEWPACGRAGAAEADVGVTSALWAVAETGSIVVSSAAPGGRAPSLLPPVHVAFVPRVRLLATIADLFRAVAALPERPSNLVIVTGPSKSADIGMELLLGVHGPGEVHVAVTEPEPKGPAPRGASAAAPALRDPPPEPAPGPGPVPRPPNPEPEPEPSPPPEPRPPVPGR